MNQLNRQRKTALTTLKARQQSENAAIMEDIEVDTRVQTDKAQSLMTDAFLRERKVIAERQLEEMNSANEAEKEALKRRHADEMRALQAAQNAAKADMEAELAQAAEERKAKLRNVLEEKAKNELKLANTLFRNQSNEIEKLKDDALLAQKAGDITREADLKKQQEALQERLRLRERRLVVKNNKESEFLEAQLAETEKIERDALVSNITATKNRMIERARQVYTNPADLQDEMERIDRLMAFELESQQSALNSKLATERLARKGELAERQAEEKKAAIATVQEEIEELIQAKRRIEEGSSDGSEQKLSDNAKKAVEMLFEQQRIKEELEKQRREQADTMDLAKVKEEALREIRRREKENGEKLSDAQRKAIFEECKANAARLSNAMNDDQSRQQRETQKRLDERRRKNEMEALRAQMAKQEEDQRKKNAELAKKISIKPVSAELPKEVIAAEEEMDLRMNRAKEALKRKQDDDARKMEAQMEDELKKYQEKEMDKLKKEADRKRLEMLSQQSAKEGMAMSEEARDNMVKAHEAQAKALQDQLDNEAAVQRAKLQEKLEAHRRKKRGEMQEKQRVETVVEVGKHEEEKDQFVRQAKLNHEKRAIEEAVKKANGAAKAEEVAEIVMSDRHRQEMQDLQARQAKRRIEEKEARDSQLENIRTDVKALLEKRLTELNAMPADDPKRDQLINDSKMSARKLLAEREKKHNADTEGRLEELDVQSTEEQLQLKMRQWDDVARTCGLKAPEAALAKYQAKVAQRQGPAAVSAEDELAKFRAEREKENARVQDQMRKDKEEYEAKLQAEMERMRSEQAEELKRREAALTEEIRVEKARKERKLNEAREAAAKSGQKPGAMKSLENQEKQMLEDGKEAARRMEEDLAKERERQEQARQNLLRLRMEKRGGKKAADGSSAAASPTNVAAAVQSNISTMAIPNVQQGGSSTSATSTTTTNTTNTTNQYVNMAAGGPQFTMAPMGQQGGAMMPGGAQMAYNPAMMAGHYQQWVGGVIHQLQASPIMEKLIKIEKMLQSQTKNGMLSYYLDIKDRKTQNEGKLVVAEPSSLTNAQIIVLTFAESVREKIEISGIDLPKVEVAIAKSLPSTGMGATSFRNSYFYDEKARKLYIRDSRLSTIGEFIIVMFHALAHVKAAGTDGQPNWNDADPSFLTQFYGLLEVCAEEMFYMRLNPTKACRDQQRGRGFRTDDIMSKDSFTELEQQIEQLGDEETRKQVRQEFLKMYFEF
eukprot:GILI01001723.1.p1 GENE.GILI01001723.1~~GILI01001723.1.p1  ORF type:complete len:1359 (-),score=635.87 GILI01001723.1:499-4206(-)